MKPFVASCDFEELLAADPAFLACGRKAIRGHLTAGRVIEFPRGALRAVGHGLPSDPVREVDLPRLTSLVRAATLRTGDIERERSRSRHGHLTLGRLPRP